MSRRALFLAIVAMTACRDGIGTFRADPPEQEPGQAVRLTFAPGDQRYPAWSSQGDFLYYSGESFAGVPATAGGIYRIRATGGTAVPVFPALQSPQQGGPRWFAVPAPSPDGQDLAVLELTGVGAGFGACDAGETHCFLPEPLLESGQLRVMDVADAAQAAVAGIEFAGRDRRARPPQPRLYEDHVFPFQRHFADEGALPVGPSWSPAGDRLVFSDGLRLLIWQPATAAPSVIAGTLDGALPAWSPDGDRIAFTRFVRSDSTIQQCDCAIPRGVATNRRTGYLVVRREVWLIAPDGSGATRVGAGESPTWATDGASLFVRRNDRIERIDLDGALLDVVSGTEGGHDPAVSPDGLRLAFSRAEPAGSGYDVWVVELGR